MQYEFSLIPNIMNEIKSTLSPNRIERYMKEAKYDVNVALRLYIWNIRLCEAAYLVLQIAEVSYRNYAHKAVRLKYKDWYKDNSLSGMLKDHLSAELKRSMETNKNKNDAEDRIVASLSMGFWHNITSNKFRGHFFDKNSLPMIAKLHEDFNTVRNLRNRVAHHKPIFDKRPKSGHDKALKIIKQINPSTWFLAKELSNFDRVLGRKPAILPLLGSS